MTTAKQVKQQVQDAAPAAVEAAPALRPAAESTDPAVHTLIADLTALRQAGQDEDAVAVLDRLPAAGYSA